jgi:MFS family permease
MLRFAVFKYGDLAPIPSFVRFIFPLASRPWRRRDLEEKPDTVPYVNAKGFVDFAPGDEEDPRNWGRPRCWYICIVAVFIVLNGTISSGLSSGSITSIAKEFGVSQVAAGLSTTLFVLGYCAGPFVFAPLSEFYGRRWLLYCTFLSYLAFTALCAFAPNFGSLLVGRFFSGTFVSAPLCTAPGVIADLWDPLIRDNIMVLFAFAVWAGPSLGTVLAGLLAEAKDWRWAFYFSLMLGALAVIFMITIPETLAVTILKEKAIRHRQARTAGLTTWKTEEEDSDVSIVATYKTALLRPWVLLFDSISLLAAIYMAVVFLLQFMLFSIYPIIFQDIRGWSSAIAQLPILGAVVGAAIAAIGILFDTQRRMRVYQKRGYLVPEDHLLIAKIGGVGFSVSMFWFAWTGHFQ